MFSTSLPSSKEALPMPAWTMPAFSTRNSTAPPLAARTAPATSIDTVPTFGFGIRPRGPSTLPRRPTSGIMSGVAMQRSKSMVPPWTTSTRSSAPTTSAPAALASSALAPRANTATRTVRPEPFGKLQTPRTIWSAWRGSTPRFIEISMVSSNFALARSLISFTASWIGYSLVASTPSRAARMRLPSFTAIMPSLCHFHAHRARGALDHGHGGFNGVAVEIDHLLLGDLADLVAGHAADIAALAGGLRTLVHLRGLRVEGLAEFHDVQAALTERRADRRRRAGCACGHLKLNVARDFLCHRTAPIGPLARSQPSGMAVADRGAAL